MTEQSLVKMSAKGQLVVPEEIRRLENFQAGDRFVAFAGKEGILFKRVHIPDVKAEFEKLSKELQAKFKKEKIGPEVIDEAVKWARAKGRH